MKYINYRGEFLSVAGIRWRVEILLNTLALVRRTLEFDANPLTIEWGEESKEVPVCGSTATLNIISPGDRSYIGLYTEDPAGVRMDVYREGVLYWSGCLDPEFYEEPYSSAKGYTVSLTFSDFGSLDRLRYTHQGKKTLGEIVRSAVDTLDIKYLDIDTSLVSGWSQYGLAVRAELLDLNVDSANFYDEDGEAMSLRDVITGVLQPLALRMVQRAGKIWVYDINALYGSSEIPIEWQSTNQMLGVDKVYNNAKVTWSPYVKSELSAETKCWTKTKAYTDTEVYNSINSATPVKRNDGTDLFSYHSSKDLGKWEDKTDLGFVLLTSTEGTGATIHSPLHRFYALIPSSDGQESEGVAMCWPSITNTEEVFAGQASALGRYLNGNLPEWWMDVDTADSPVITFDRVSIPSSYNTGVKLRVSMNMLMDPRYNPFESAVDSGIFAESYEMNVFNSNVNYVYVPVKIKFRPAGQDSVLTWTNRTELRYAPSERILDDLTDTQGSWRMDADDIFAYLAWYDMDDRAGATGVTGWKKNRQAINPHTQPLSSALENYGEGQRIPFPPNAENGGELWVEILNRPWIVRTSSVVYDGIDQPLNDFELYGARLTEWLLVEPPVITVEYASVFHPEIPDEDVEYQGVLNNMAKEDIEIDTICGTAKGGVVMARGAYYYPTGEQVTELIRAGRAGQAENLLIGTLYSQFGSRKTKLTGTSSMNGEGVCTYTDASSEGVKFMLVGAVENPREDTLEGTYVEVRPDEYEDLDITVTNGE